MEQLEEMIETDEVSIDEFMSVFTTFFQHFSESNGTSLGSNIMNSISSLNDSRNSHNSQGNSNDSSLSVFNDENDIPDSELMKAPQDLDTEPNSIAYSVGTYSGLISCIIFTFATPLFFGESAC